MEKEITLKNEAENRATSWDVLVEVDDETYEYIEEAEVDEEVEFEASFKQGYMSLDKAKFVVKPKYPCATNGAITIEEIEVENVSGGFEEKRVGDFIKVKGRKTYLNVPSYI